MNCPICSAKLTSWAGGLISCKGTPTGPRHKFYLRWRNRIPSNSDETRQIELAVKASKHKVGVRWGVKDAATFPPA